MDQNKEIQKAFKEALKNELVPLLVGIRADIADQMKSFEENGGGFKFHLSKEMFDQITVRDGKTPEKGVDYFTHDEVATIVRLSTPVKGKHYFTKKDINDIVKLCVPKKGRDYRDGSTPVKGKDYFTAAERKEFLEAARPIRGLDYRDGYTPIKGKDYFDGKDGSAITGLQIVDKLTSLSKLERLPISAIRGLREALDSISNAISGQGSGIGGSGSGSSPSAASGARFETPTEIPDGTNQTFTVANRPNAVVLNQLWYFENDGYTWNAVTSKFTFVAGLVPVANSTIRSSY